MTMQFRMFIRTFEDDGNANLLGSVSLSGSSGLVYMLYYISSMTGGNCGSDIQNKNSQR